MFQLKNSRHLRETLLHGTKLARPRYCAIKIPLASILFADRSGETLIQLRNNNCYANT